MKPLYPGFTEIDLRPSNHESVSKLPDRVRTMADEIATDAVWMHDERHNRLRHPLCVSCEVLEFPDWQHVHARSIPQAAANVEYVALIQQHVDRKRPDDWIVEQLAAFMDPADVRAIIEATRAEDAYYEFYERQREEVILRAARYYTLHGRPPVDLYDGSDDQTDDGLYLTREQLANLPTPSWIVDGVIPEYAYALLTGRDHSYKSFIAVALACSIATGQPWLGRDVQQRRVLYIAGEGAHGLDQRISAWEYAWNHGKPVTELTTRKEAIDLNRGGQALQRLIDRIEADGYGLVIIDTLNKCSGAANTNSPEANTILASIERIKRATDAGSVLVLAHTDKSDLDTRGYSAIEDDSDVVWHARRDGHELALVNRKMKEAPDGERLELTARPVLDSLVLQSGDNRGDLDDANASQAAILQLLADTFSHTGATKAELRDTCGLPRSTYYRALNSLIADGRVVVTGKGSAALYRTWIPTPSGTEIPTEVATVRRDALTDSQSSHDVSVDSHASNRDSHESHTSLEVGRWESVGLAEMEGIQA